MLVRSVRPEASLFIGVDDPWKTIIVIDQEIKSQTIEFTKYCTDNITLT